MHIYSAKGIKKREKKEKRKGCRKWKVHSIPTVTAEKYIQRVSVIQCVSKT